MVPELRTIPHRAETLLIIHVNTAPAEGPFRKQATQGLLHMHLGPKAQVSSPLPELLEDHSVGKALAADSDALKDTIAAQLVQHQVWVQFPGLERKAHGDCLTVVPRS